MSEGWNILVVDDEPPIRAELRYLLENTNLVVTRETILCGAVPHPRR